MNQEQIIEELLDIHRNITMQEYFDKYYEINPDREQQEFHYQKSYESLLSSNQKEILMARIYEFQIDGNEEEILQSLQSLKNKYDVLMNDQEESDKNYEFYCCNYENENKIAKLYIGKKVFIKNSEDEEQNYEFDVIKEDLLEFYLCINDNCQHEEIVWQTEILKQDLESTSYLNDSVIEALLLLAKEWKNVGNFSKYFHCIFKCFELSELLYESESEEHSKYLYHLADAYYNIDQRAFGLRYIELCFKIRKEFYEDNEGNTSFIQTKLLLCKYYDWCKNLLISKQYYDELLTLIKEQFGDDSKLYAKASLQYAKMNQHSEDYIFEASNLANNAKDLYTTQYGEDSIQVAQCLEIIASICETQGISNEVLNLYQKAIQIYKNKLPAYHPMIGYCYLELAMLHHLIHSIDSAIFYYNEAIKVFSKAFGEYRINITDLYYNLGNVHLDKQDYQKALDYHFKSYALRKKMWGNENLIVAQSAHQIGALYEIMQGKEESLYYLNEALQIYRSIYGENTEYTAIAYYNVAIACKNLNKLEDSLTNQLKALEIRRLLYPSMNPNIATSLYQIGYLYTNLQNYEEAKKYHLEAYQIRKDIYGNDNMLVAQSLAELAYIYEIIGEYDESLNCYEEQLEIHNEYFEPMSKQILNSYLNMAIVYELKKSYEKALEFQLKGLEIVKLVESSQKITFSFYCIGRLFNMISKFAEALEYLIEAKNRLEPAQEEELEIWKIYYEIARAYYHKGDNDLAIKYFEESIQLAIKYLGKDSNWEGKCHQLVGKVYNGNNKYYSALQHFQEALRIRRKVYGNKHITIAQTIYEIAFIYNKICKYECSIRLYQEALKIYQVEEMNQHNEEIAMIFDNIGNIYLVLKNYEQANKYIQKAYEIRLSINGKYRNEDIYQSLNSLGYNYQIQGKYNEALKYHQQALQLAQEIKGSESLLASQSLLNIGIINYNCQNIDKARELLEKSYSIRMNKKQMKSSLTVAEALFHLAELYEQEQNYNQAISCHKQALDMRKENLPYIHLDIALSLQKISKIYQLMNNYKEALLFAKQALDIVKSIFANKHEDVAQAYVNMGAIFIQLKSYDRALENYNLAYECYKSLNIQNLKFEQLCYEIGNLYLVEEKYESAINFYEQSLQINKLQGSKDYNVCQCYCNLGIAYEKLEKFDEAKHCQKEASILTTEPSSNNEKEEEQKQNLLQVYELVEDSDKNYKKNTF